MTYSGGFSPELVGAIGWGWGRPTSVTPVGPKLALTAPDQKQVSGPAEAGDRR